MFTNKKEKKFSGFLLTAVLAAVMFMTAVLPASLQTLADDGLAVDPVDHAEGYSAKLYDNTNGLPASEANDIAETSEGFIWIGSYAGLIRYDGNTFERIDSTTGIASVVCLFTDSSDRLWIGTNDSGVAVMEGGGFRMWGKSEGLGSASVRAIMEDQKGMIYVATTEGIAVIDQDMNLHTLSDPLISDAYMRDLRLGSDGLIYGLTQEGSIFTLDGDRVVDFISADETGIPGVLSFLPDPLTPGLIYLGTDNSKIYHGSLESKLSDVDVEDISPLSYVECFEYLNDEIWICSGNGIGVLREDGFHEIENLPMNNSFSRMMTDYEGNLWFTSTRQGVMKIVPNQFANVYERFQLEPDVVNSTCRYKDMLFSATDNRLTVIGQNGAVESLPLKSAVTASGVSLETDDLIEYLEGCRIRSLIRDSKNRLWIATWRKYGLLCYDDGDLTAFTPEDGLFSDRVRVVFEAKDGRILVANTGGVNVIEDGKVTESYGEDAGIINVEILTVVEADNGDIILGSDGGGIYIIENGSDRVTHYIGTEEGLSSEVIMRIRHDDPYGVYWIVTSNSIAYMSEDYRVTTVQKFPYSNNFDLYDNGQGEMWILSSNGIYVAGVDELLANGSIAPVYYGMDNGLPCITTANSYSELTESGDLYIAGTTGVVHVNIVKPNETVDNLKVSVPYVDADNERVYPDESGNFTLRSGVRKLTVYSYVFNYSLQNPMVTYQLKGFEDKGTTVIRSDLMPVDYTNLPGGEYLFSMTLSDSLGHSNKEFSVEITKEKAFFEEVWFYILIGGIIFVLIVLAVRFYISKRTQALEKKHRETMTFVSEITEAFAKVIDMKDNYTNGHSSRVAKYTAMLAKELGYDDETVEKYYRIALLHDIGKVGVPSEVLNKPGKLTDEEFAIIKSHAAKGYDALKDISIMPELATGAGAHHERPDGKGYPNHLSGDQIPRVAQIIAVADCFDAMYSNRPYRNRMNFEKAISIIKEVSGTQLTPDVVDALIRLADAGKLRDPDDHGGGTTEDIVNVRN